MYGVKISEVPGAMLEKKEEYIDDHEQTRGQYSHTKDGKRYYELEENIGYNLGIIEQGQVRLTLKRWKLSEIIRDVERIDGWHFDVMADAIISALPALIIVEE